MRESDTLLQRLRRIRSLICKHRRRSDEVSGCPCVRGGYDVNRDYGAETGCKDIHDAIQELKDCQDE